MIRKEQFNEPAADIAAQIARWCSDVGIQK